MVLSDTLNLFDPLFPSPGNSRDRIEQETFVNCADVVITNKDGSLDEGLVMPEVPQIAYTLIVPEEPIIFGQGKLVGDYSLC